MTRRGSGRQSSQLFGSSSVRAETIRDDAAALECGYDTDPFRLKTVCVSFDHGGILYGLEKHRDVGPLKSWVVVRISNVAL